MKRQPFDTRLDRRDRSHEQPQVGNGHPIDPGGDIWAVREVEAVLMLRRGRHVVMMAASMGFNGDVIRVEAQHLQRPQRRANPNNHHQPESRFHVV